MHDMHITLNCLGFEVHNGERLVTLYRAVEELPRSESPKPCFAPIYTPSGGLITEYRPADHPWHTGMYYGWVHVNDANLWGGGWYIPDSGKYEDVPDTHGKQLHEGFSEPEVSNNETAVTEHLTWFDASDKPLATETRRFRFRTTSKSLGYFWLIETEIKPVNASVTLGASRAARYSGLMVRTGPPFADGVYRSSDGLEGHENIMGQTAKWVSAKGSTGGMIVLMDHSDNPRHPTPWFTRKNILSAGLLMNGDMDISQTDSLHLKYGFVILDSVVNRDEVDVLYQEFLESF